MELLQIILASGGAFLLGIAAVITAVKASAKRNEKAAVSITDDTARIVEKLVDGHILAISLISDRLSEQRKDINQLERELERHTEAIEKIQGKITNYVADA